MNMLGHISNTLSNYPYTRVSIISNNCRYIKFFIHIFFNYLVYIETKREIISFCQTNYLTRFVFFSWMSTHNQKQNSPITIAIHIILPIYIGIHRRLHYPWFLRLKLSTPNFFEIQTSLY